jgi:hypothetical protein
MRFRLVGPARMAADPQQGATGWRRSFFGQVQHQKIIKSVLGYPRLAGAVPREFSRFCVQFDVVWNRRTQQLTRHEQAYLIQFLFPALARCVMKRMVMARDEVIRLITREKLCCFRFFSADARLGRNVTKNEQRPPCQVRKVGFFRSSG